MTKRLARTALLALGAFVAMAGAAFAVPLYATQDANIYATQDLQSTPIAVMPRGTIAEGHCENGGWCFVNQFGGWVSAAFIDNPPAQPAPQQPAQPNPPQPNPPQPNNPGFSFGFNFGTPNKPRPPIVRQEDDEVCFYTSTNFRGKSFCAEPGDASNRLGSSWNELISSIEVFGDAEVDVCTDRNMRGSCTTISNSTSRLPSRLNDQISSFEVY